MVARARELGRGRRRTAAPKKSTAAPLAPLPPPVPKGGPRGRRPRRPEAAPTQPTDDVRARVLAAATRLIDEGGLARLSMREVARAAGVSHQAPYHYFADRESILAAIAEEGFKILASRLEATRDATPKPTLRLVALARVYVEFAVEHPSMFRLMFRPDFVDVERFPEAKACGERAFATLPATVAHAIAIGFPAEPSAQALMVLGWSIAHGLACLLLDGPLARKMPEAVADRDELIRGTMEALRHLLEARMPRPDAPERSADEEPEITEATITEPGAPASGPSD